MGILQSKLQQIRHNNKKIRIVLVGKTGVGKSATANTILGRREFTSRCCPKSVTECCTKADGEVDGQKVSVIDTPGLYDTRVDGDKTCEDIAQCVAHASPGPHIFLVIIKLDRFTEEEKQSVQKIQQIFGEEANKYSMVLFTHGDQLREETLQEYLRESEELQELVAKCNGQYHVFDNNLEDRSQVSELLLKIRDITKKNGGNHYTSDMFQKAERGIEEEKRRILKDKEEQMQKEQEELKKKIKEKHMQLVKAEADTERKTQLMAACENEVEKEMENLIEQQEAQARKEAEGSTKLLLQLAKIVGTVLVLSVGVLLA